MDETGRRHLSGINCTPELAQKSSGDQEPLRKGQRNLLLTSTSSPSLPKEAHACGKRTKSPKSWRERFFPGCEVLVAHNTTQNTCTPT